MANRSRISTHVESSLGCFSLYNKEMNLQDEVTSSINPGDDFYNYANKKWRDNNPIPPDKARRSAMTDLGETVIEQLRKLLEKTASTNDSGNSALAKKLYLSGMDEAAIEK